MSPDLKNATAFVTPLGDDDPARLIPALGRATPYLRSCLGREIKLRHTPNLSFKADTSFDEAQRIEALLRQPRVQRDLDAAPTDAAPREGRPTTDDEDDG
jgi:ribosome-binding factor A